MAVCVEIILWSYYLYNIDLKHFDLNDWTNTMTTVVYIYGKMYNQIESHNSDHETTLYPVIV